MDEPDIQAMDEAELEAELVRLHERWLRKSREVLLERLQHVLQVLSITRQILMLLTLEPQLLESVGLSESSSGRGLAGDGDGTGPHCQQLRVL